MGSLLAVFMINLHNSDCTICILGMEIKLHILSFDIWDMVIALLWGLL